MKTDDLIANLAAAAGQSRPAPDRALALAALGAVAVAALLFFATIGPRPDIAQAVGTWRFDYKFLVTLALAVSALALVRRALYPQPMSGAALWLLLVAPALLGAAVVVELVSQPQTAWAMSAVGKNALLCLTIVPSLGLVPLGLILWSLRQGAPTRPALAGVLAGLAAGGIAATFYAANCTDDSPLFVATWYPLAILVLAGAGGVVGRFVLRW